MFHNDDSVMPTILTDSWALPLPEGLYGTSRATYALPPDMSFAKRDALFPLAALRAIIAAGFETWCRVLIFRPFPTWDKVQPRSEGVRSVL
jgi:hypothetical protein